MFKARFFRATMASMALALAPVATSFAADERQSLEELRNTVVNLLNALVEQGVISRDKAAQMVKAAQDKAAADAAAVAKADEGAVRVPYVPQIVKDEIAKQVASKSNRAWSPMCSRMPRPKPGEFPVRCPTGSRVPAYQATSPCAKKASSTTKTMRSKLI